MDAHFMTGILSSLGDGVIAVDTAETIIFMNEAAEKITGWKSDKARAHAFSAVFRLYNAKTRKLLVSPLAFVLQTNMATGLENESVLIMPDNTVKYISANCTPITESGGQITGAVIVFRDVSRYKMLEKKLEHEENNFRVMFNSAPVGMCTVDKRDMIIQVNDEALNMLGKTRSQIIGKTFGDAFGCQNELNSDKGCGYGDACQYCEFRRVTSLAFEGLTAQGVECSKTIMREGQKKPIWFKASAAPIDVEGQTCVLVALMDITDQKEKEISITQTRDFYLRIFESFPTIIWRCNLAGETESINENWHALTGQTLGEAIGYGWLDCLHPDDKKNASELCPLSELAESEIRVLDRNGQYRWLYRVCKLYYNMHEKPEGYICMGIDITDRKFAQEGLNRYKVLSEQAQDIILFVDMDGKIIEANQAAIKAYGYSHEELIKETIFALGRMDKESAVKLQDAVRQGTGAFFETVHSRKDQAVFPVEINCQGTIIGGKRVLLSIIRDISERKKAEEELKQAKERAEAANKAKSEFLANMSHEIRTPINGIMGMIDLTLREGLEGEQKENLEIAKSCAQVLLGIINDILDFSKMEAGKLSLEEVCFNFRDFISDVIKTYLYRAEMKGLTLHHVLSADIPKIISGDPQRLRQILNNLLDNAIKFTEQGEVGLEIKKIGGSDKHLMLEFAVSDTGIGIAENEMNKLFKTFSQVDGSITRKHGGTGLGLVISKQLAEMMQGAMWVKSSKWQGSTFYFTIVCKKGVLEDQPSLTFPSSKLLIPLKILLVEDDSISRIVMEKTLGEAGCQVITAKNGVIALSLLQKELFDVVLMDIQMPIMDGLQTTRKIREAEQTGKRRMPVIALTAHALAGDRERCMAAGMDDYIAKPVQVSELIEKLNKVTPQSSAGPMDIGNLAISETGDIVLETRGIFPISPANLAQLETLVAQSTLAKGQTVQELEKCAHALKELAGQLGWGELRRAAFKAELAVRRRNITEALAGFAAIRQMVNSYKKD